MLTKRIRTSHELADTLEELAKALRMLPEFEMHPENLTQPSRQPSAPDSGHKVPSRMAELADTLHSLQRDDAEGELNALTLPALRQLSKLLQIRIPSRATKAETVRMLLEQVFDLPSGQELIRTFHTRNSGGARPARRLQPKLPVR